MNKIETIARAMCREDGIDPDTPVFRGEPLRIPGGYAMPVNQAGRQAWRLYVSKANAALKAALDFDLNGDGL